MLTLRADRSSVVNRGNHSDPSEKPAGKLLVRKLPCRPEGRQIAAEILENERRNYQPDEVDRFLSRTRYFIDSGIIGSKEFAGNIKPCCEATGSAVRIMNLSQIPGLAKNPLRNSGGSALRGTTSNRRCRRSQA
jgi:hypothetical protein